MDSGPLTVTELTDQLGCSRWQVQYRLKALSIRPIRLAGNVRLYPPSTLEQLRTAIRESPGTPGYVGASGITS